MSANRHTPVIFVSSTCYDLKQVREDLRDFFEENYGLQAMLSEFDSFPVDPCIGTFENCLNNVDEYADIFLLIIGNRYGYVTENGKSITNLEYLHAKAKGIPIFVFVEKQLYNQLKIWDSNKEGDFSGIVDNTRIFEFVLEIYNEAKQWVYTYDSVKDIESTMKHQLGLIISDGLLYKQITNRTRFNILDSDISKEAKRVFVEKPYAWEYKFLAHVMKNDFNELQKNRWNLKYGISANPIVTVSSTNIFEEISLKLSELTNLISILDTLLNITIQDAIGAPGEPSDLEMIVYVSKQLTFLYERMVAWALYFKAVHTDETFAQLLQLLYDLPKSILMQIDDFVEKMYTEIIHIPDVDDHVKRNIKLSCVLDISNLDEVNAEINRLYKILVE